MRAKTRGVVALLSGVVVVLSTLGAPSAAQAASTVCPGTVDKSVRVQILTPTAGSTVDLAKTPEFTVSGSVSGDRARRVTSLNIFIGAGLAGSAQLQSKDDRVAFVYRTGAPAGPQSLTACARTQDGKVASATVSVNVLWPAPDAVVVHPDTRVLTAAQSAAITSVTATSIIFAGQVPFVAGNVLVATGPTVPQGLLRRVVAVRRVGARSVVTTTAASITDVLLQANVEETVPVTAAQNTTPPASWSPAPSTQAVSAKIATLAAASATLSTPTFQLSDTLAEKDVDGVTLSVSGSLSASGSLTFYRKIDIRPKLCGFKLCADLRTVELRFDGSVNTSGEVAVSAKKELAYSHDIPGVHLVEVLPPFMIGPVPVVMTAVLEVAVGGRVSVGLQHTFSWDSNRSISAGFIWDKDTGVDLIGTVGSSSTDLDSPDQKNEIVGEADLYVRPELDLLIYGLAGPTFQLETGWHWGLSAGIPDLCPGKYSRGPYLEPIIGVKLAVLWADIAEKTYSLPRASMLDESPLPWCAATPPLTISGTTIPDGTIGVGYTGALHAAGGTGPYQWDLIAGSLPTGLTLLADGTISGTPSAEGAFVFRALVHDAKGAATDVEFTGRVNAALPPIQPGTGGGGVVQLPVVDSCSGACALSWGDPHLTTIDGLSYDVQKAGEFVLTRSTADDLDVQVRQQPWGSSRLVAVNTAVGLRVVGHRVSDTATTAGAVVRLDGVPVTTTGPVDLGGGASIDITPDGRRLTTTWPDGSFVTTDFYGGSSPYLSLTVRMAPARAGTMLGLLGNGNAAQADDFVTRAGEQLSADAASRAASIQTLAESWRITQSESLLDYASGESTATFTDLAFPYGNITVDSLPVQQRAAAEAACAAAGVQSPDVLPACVLDVAVTGDTTAAGVAATAQGGVTVVAGAVAAVTAGVPAQTVPFTGYVFLDRSYAMTIPAGAKVVLASAPDGTGDVYVDDRVEVVVTHADGTTSTFGRGFEFQPPAPPLDLTASFATGSNTIRVRLLDTFGGAYSSTPLYIVVLAG